MTPTDDVAEPDRITENASNGAERKQQAASSQQLEASD